ncbi:mannonate dehydratase [Oleiphilus messinensis]|uniref:Mannonate dehydratase n=1 Tax=Oleiphilus messinensis TaxID=141451 RepID=A0A1Y0IH44_9GAMM|nr:mannonate dehydratase [Oleiphilus messinensis]ARU59459.1 mannonate dehydratase [Oleiphilus messinensis]
MEQSWRWYGPEDPVSLNDIRQAGATAVVTALHHIANGEVWPEAEIQARKAQIEAKGLRWNVVESVPVHEEIKTRSGQVERWIANYQQTLINLSRCGIHTVCYNFMPVLDWTRTDLDYELPDGSKALRFDQDAFAAFDLFILQRPGAADEYPEEEQLRARQYLQHSNQEQRDRLTQTIIAGLPGAEEHYTLEDFRHQLARYADIDKKRLRDHLLHFLKALMPICEAKGIRLAIHPDDPPRPLFGLPRIVSTLEDIEWLTQAVPQLNNGLTFCTGSYGVRSDNDLLFMVKRFADRIYFTHLRSTQREPNPLSFHEAAHLTGDVDMVGIVMEILREEHRRELAGREDLIAMRPDHGHQILDDLHKKTNPGYSAIGRLKGLAEIRGLELALKRSFFSAN